MLCHTECLNKVWELQEKDRFGWKRTPHIKDFECLSEARKALTTYIKNPDFQHLEFRLHKREVE